MPTLNEGDPAPDFTLPADEGAVTLSDFHGRMVVLYFYPKDDTPGCTKQACAFRDHMDALAGTGVAIIGVSRDSVSRHRKFRDKYGLNFPLASDEDGTVCELYGTWVEKKLYGRTYMGIDRATFLIDEAGVIRRIWRKVKVAGHVDQIRDEIDRLKQAA